MIKVLGLSHKRENQIDTRIYWFIFHNIYCMNIDVNNKEERNSTVILTSMSEHEESKKSNKELKDSRDNDDNNQPILKNCSSLLI